MGAGHLGMRLVERFGVGKLGTTNGTKDTNGGAVEGWRDGCRPFGDEIGRKIWGRKIGNHEWHEGHEWEERLRLAGRRGAEKWGDGRDGGVDEGWAQAIRG
jgi:hypothetical protein